MLLSDDLPPDPTPAPAPAVRPPSVALNREQSWAVSMAEELCDSADEAPVGVLSGYAGTGKTTVLQAIGASLGLKATYATPTGRAAYRVRQQTGMHAQTLHSLFYTPVEDPETKRLTFRRRSLDELAEVIPRVLVIDEASMVGQDLWADIENVCQLLHASVLLVGDGAQLMPVEMRKDRPPFSVFAPNFPAQMSVTLTEVFRQALDSPILSTATRVREATSWHQVHRALHSGALPWLQYPVHDVSAHMRRKGQDHVIIAHKNATRLNLNHWVRYACGLPNGAPLQNGEPLLVRRNSQDLGVNNGEIIPLKWLQEPPISMGKDGAWVFHKAEVNGVQCGVHAPTCLEGNDETLPKWAPASLAEDFALPFLRAHLGYVITCHSAQGSEWPTTFVGVENSLHAMPENERQRWIYTALTRAKTECWLFNPG